MCSVTRSGAPKASKVVVHCGRLIRPFLRFQSNLGAMRALAIWPYVDRSISQRMSEFFFFCWTLCSELMCQKCHIYVFFFVFFFTSSFVEKRKSFCNTNKVKKTETKEFHITKSLPRQNPKPLLLAFKNVQSAY